MGRPVFFFDERSGALGKPFRLVKFRSMLDGVGSDAERLTRFGRFLRSTSLDELPELWNVIKGEMSLVGPRPLPVRYLPRYTDEQRRRLEVRPGVTGLAQINGRNQISWSDKFHYDLEYVERQSLLLDVKILLLTVGKVLLQSGVNNSANETMPEFDGESHG
jgi:lipopolysaccharide/colanic/teichoic acid biosynthesis glycosyltransferase